ncbi:MAG: hypothetical protein LUF27_05025 [Lachnospiraceae bacterium]|nr:hypothetical protein [Lachnospiraceae bacterium]
MDMQKGIRKDSADEANEQKSVRQTTEKQYIEENQLTSTKSCVTIPSKADLIHPKRMDEGILSRRFWPGEKFGNRFVFHEK